MVELDRDRECEGECEEVLEVCLSVLVECLVELARSRARLDDPSLCVVRVAECEVELCVEWRVVMAVRCSVRCSAENQGMDTLNQVISLSVLREGGVSSQLDECEWCLVLVVLRLWVLVLTSFSVLVVRVTFFTVVFVRIASTSWSISAASISRTRILTLTPLPLAVGSARTSGAAPLAAERGADGEQLIQLPEQIRASFKMQTDQLQDGAYRAGRADSLSSGGREDRPVAREGGLGRWGSVERVKY